MPRKFRSEFLSPIGSHQMIIPKSIFSLSRSSKSNKKFPRIDVGIGSLKEK
jgi:hypothetical protein